MNIKTEFEMALLKQEFESSDDKLKLWKEVKQQNKDLFALIILAMEFSFELGTQYSEDE